MEFKSDMRRGVILYKITSNLPYLKLYIKNILILGGSAASTKRDFPYSQHRALAHLKPLPYLPRHELLSKTGGKIFLPPSQDVIALGRIKRKCSQGVK